MEYQLENDELLVQFTTKGAECTRIYSKKLDRDYLWNADANYWNRHAPVLFPIVGKLQDNQYEYKGKVYQLNQHGFARDMEFKLFEQDTNMISFTLEANEETLALYPFKFRLKITYTLEHNSLNIAYQVDNLMDDSDLYFSIGGHPGFRVPFVPETEFSDYRLTIKNSEKELLRLPLQGAYIDKEHAHQEVAPFDLELNHELFANDAMIYQTKGVTDVILHHKNQKDKIVMSYNDYDFVGIWSPYPKEAPFVCLEPWKGIADTIDSNGNLIKKFAIQKLAKNDYWRASYRLQFIHEDN